MCKQKKIKYIAAIFPFVVFFSSCLGVNAEITLNANGSGTIALEYYVSNLLDSLGRLDGNERWNTIPAGRADFERTLARLPDMKLLSFSARNDGKNLITTAKMEFETIDGLLAFLDAGGRRSSFSGGGRQGRISFILNEGAKRKNFQFDNLVADVFESYTIGMSFNLPREGTLLVSDNSGSALTAIPGSRIVSSGKKLFFSFPVYEVLSSKDGINVEFSW